MIEENGPMKMGPDGTYAFEDYQIGNRTLIGPYLLTRDEILNYAKLYDPQSHLIDETASPLIASNWMVLAASMRMMCDAYLLKSTSQGSPGVENIEWHEVAKEGDILTASVEVLSKRVSKSRPNLGLVHIRMKIQTQNDVLICTMQHFGLLGLRHPMKSGEE